MDVDKYNYATSAEQEISQEPIAGPSTSGCQRIPDVIILENQDLNNVDNQPPEIDKYTDAIMKMARTLECPICLSFITPPIKSCTKGHGICGNCFVKITVCPLCQSALSHNQNTLLDNIVSELMFPCDFQEFGCRQMMVSADKVKHQNICKFNVFECPIDGCTWRGKQGELAVHLKHVHNRSIFSFKENIRMKSFAGDIFKISVFNSLEVTRKLREHVDRQNSIFILFENEIMTLYARGPPGETQHHALQLRGNTDSSAKSRYKFIFTSDSGLRLTHDGVPTPCEKYDSRKIKANNWYPVPWEIYENFFQMKTADFRFQLQIFRNEKPIQVTQPKTTEEVAVSKDS